MSGVNHIVGGTVFTAIFSSFWNINVFSKVSYLLFCITVSILPDIDYRQSPIGRLFYPLARYIERNFGHRTITHSLSAFIPMLVGSLILERYLSNHSNFSIILGFSYASHLIFDMMTKEGVPLFYPFDKTPCVIPGNPDLRIKNGNFKTECVIFIIFVCIGVSCRPLFKQGFWTTLNKSFGTTKHIYYEFLNSPKQLINVSYHFYHLGKSHQGNAYLIYATPEKVILFNQGFIEVNKDFQIKKLSPTKTTVPYETKDISFQDISIDSLLSIIESKALLSLQLECNLPIQYTTENGSTITSNQLNLNYIYNPFISVKAKQQKKKNYQLRLLNHQLETLLEGKKSIEEKQALLRDSIKATEPKTVGASCYEREKLTRRIRELRKELEKTDLIEKKEKYDRKIQHILIQIDHINEIPIPRCKGHMKYIKGI
jgi:inner membrane protein